MSNPFAQGKNPFDFKQHGHRAISESMFALGLWFILWPMLVVFILLIGAYWVGIIDEHTLEEH